MPDEARARLEADGTPFDGRVWNEADEDAGFVKEVEEDTGCPAAQPMMAATRPAKPRLALGRQADFCGPGHEAFSTNLLDQAVNEICQHHDGCHAAYEGPMAPSRAWVRATALLSDRQE